MNNASIQTHISRFFHVALIALLGAMISVSTFAQEDYDDLVEEFGLDLDEDETGLDDEDWGLDEEDEDYQEEELADEADEYESEYSDEEVVAADEALGDDGVAAQEQAPESQYASSSRIEEVVITAERREMSLQDYAGTSVNFSEEELALGGIQNITDLAENVPGLEIGNKNGNLEVWVRGIGSSNNTELGDPAAAFHFDDVYIPRPAGIGSAFFDIARVEVNVGPQGTLRGRNAMAGSINAISWDPGIGQTTVGLEVETGNYEQRAFRGVVNLPMTEKSAMRLALYKLDHESYYNDVSPNQLGVAEEEDNFGARLKYLIEPTDRLSLLFSVEYLHEKGTGYTGTNYANPLGNDIDPDSIDSPRNVYARGFEPELDNPHWGVKFQVNYDMDWAELEYTLGYRDLVYDYRASTPLAPDYPGALASLQPIEESFDNFSSFQSLADSKSEIHELRIFTPSDNSIYYTAGLFYFRENQQTFLASTGDRATFFQGFEFNQPNTDTESFSIYGDTTWNYSDVTRYTLGLRYTDDHKDRQGVNAQYRFALGGFNTDTLDPFGCCLGARIGTEGFEWAATRRTQFEPDTDGDGSISEAEYLDFFYAGIISFGARDTLDDILANGTNDPVTGSNPGAPNPDCPDTISNDNLIPVAGKCSFVGIINADTSITPQSGLIDDDFVDWRIRAEHDFDEDLLTYGLIATGHKSGGFNDNFAELPRPPTYGTEKVTLYELGFKNTFDLFDVIPTQFNGSFFYNDYTDQAFCNVVSVAQAIEINSGNFSGVVAGGDSSAAVSLGVNFCFNAADSRIYGTQFDGKFFLPWELTLGWKALWLDAEIEESDPIQDSRYQADVEPENARFVSINGNTLPFTPEYQFNITLGQAIDLPFGRLDYLLSFGWRDDQFLTIYNARDYEAEALNSDADPGNNKVPEGRLDDEVDSYYTVDFGLGLDLADTGVRLEAYVNNLTDEQQPVAMLITQFDNTRFFTRPRVYGFRAKWMFHQ
ncbi:MAG: TonB-dependent receptor [Gammaproteobacteria bacterium]|nr:TonB-dependent receptor [Gammaproteobacteria bacterium]MBT8151420.1 TonB-dependent receptor [Gammaproteobacteria bacterium]